uniref:Uncharacterized protein n=1 Tax=Globodera rostochiensis TaxID=31243 RepID=A0A914I418_GLORO
MCMKNWLSDGVFQVQKWTSPASATAHFAVQPSISGFCVVVLLDGHHLLPARVPEGMSFDAKFRRGR